MIYRFITLTCIFCLHFALFSNSAPVIFNRDDGSLIQGYLDIPDGQETAALIVFVDGSTSASVYPNHEKLSARFKELGMAFLSLEKRGMTQETVDQTEFLQNDCFENRLEDYAILLRNLEINAPIFLLGASEGGKIAPKLCLMFPEKIDGLILIASGGGLSFAEEMQHQSQQLIGQMGMMKRLSYKLREFFLPNEYDESYAKILASPDSLEMFGPKTCKWWASYLRYDLLSDLKQVEVPIYMIHGEKDMLIPIRSADLIKATFNDLHKTNLQYARYKDLGHALTGREDVYTQMTDWIQLRLHN